MTTFISSMMARVTPIVSPLLNACKDKISEVYQKIRPFGNGTLVKEHLPEVAIGLGAQAVGMQLGTAFPVGAIVARVGITAGQMAYKTFKSTSTTDNKNGKVNYQGFVAAVTVGTLTTLFFMYNMDVMELCSPTAQYILTLLGTTAGGFVGLFMAGKNPSDPGAPWYDNYINRNMRYIAAQHAVQPVAVLLPSFTTVVNAAGHLIPLPITGLFLVPAAVMDTTVPIISNLVIGHLAYYALPLGKIGYKALTEPQPTASSYENLDPNLLIKAVINGIHGNSAAFAHALISDLPLAKFLKDQIAFLTNRGVANDQIVNMIVRSINEYAAILQKPSLQAATSELMDAIKNHHRPLPNSEVVEGLRCLSKDRKTPFDQKLRDLKAYQNLLKNNPKKLQEIFAPQGQEADGEDTFFDACDPLEKINEMMPNNSCNELILSLYEKSQSAVQLTANIEELISAFEFQHQIDIVLAAKKTSLQEKLQLLKKYQQEFKEGHPIKPVLQQLISHLNVLYHREKLNQLLYQELLPSGRLPSNLEMHPEGQAALETVLAHVEEQQKALLGTALTSRARDQSMIEVHGQGFLVFFLNKSAALIQNPTTTRLTQHEIRQFFTNLNHLAWSPLPNAGIAQGLVDHVVIPLAIRFGDVIQRTISKNIIPDYDIVKIEEIPDDEFGEETIPAVASSQVEEIEDEFVMVPQSPPSLLGPDKLVKMAVNTTFGNSKTLAGTVINLPVIQYLVNKVIVGTIESDVIVNGFVRSVNLFAEILKNEDVAHAMQELAAAPDHLKNSKMKLVNRAIYNQLFNNHLFTMSYLEGWMTYGTKSIISKRISPVVSAIMEKLKENHVQDLLAPLLNPAYDEKTLEVFLRNLILLSVIMIKKGIANPGKNRPLEEEENTQFYSNLVNIIFSPFSHPVTEAFKPVVQTGLPKVLNDQVITTPLIQGILETLSEVKMEDDFVMIPEKSPETAEPKKIKDPNKPFNPIRKIQKLWYKFTAAIEFWFNEWIYSIKTKKANIAPLNSGSVNLPVGENKPVSYSRVWKKAVPHANQALHRNRVYPRRWKNSSPQTSQAGKVASTRRAHRGK